MATIRVPQVAVEPLASVKVDQETDINEQVLGADVTGKCHTTGRVEIKLTPNPTKAAFELSLVGQAVADTVGVHGPAQVGCHSVTKYRADKVVLFDGYTFTTTPAKVTADTDLTIENISSTAPGLRGRIVDRIAAREVERNYQEARHIAAQRVINRVSQSFDATVREHLDKLNRELKLKRLLDGQIAGHEQLVLRLETRRNCLHVTFLAEAGEPERLPEFKTHPGAVVRIGLNLLAIAENPRKTINAVRLLYEEKQRVKNTTAAKTADRKPAKKDFEMLEAVSVGTQHGWIVIHVVME
ncbi:MAG: hypothetical protein JXB10_10465 [Pirellulales bacterium]|nr:hypothetical protein [Pirellulales bacterium]